MKERGKPQKSTKLICLAVTISVVYRAVGRAQ